jgi:hypothetical protein
LIDKGILNLMNSILYCSLKLCCLIFILPKSN